MRSGDKKVKTRNLCQITRDEDELRAFSEYYDNYASFTKYESWGGIRFYNHAWGNLTNTTLHIREHKGETIFGVTTYILNLSEELQEEAFQILNCHEDSRLRNWKIEKYKGGAERWLCIYWDSPEPTFEAIESLILEKASLLDKIEKTLR